ncbi:hypothetical protein LAY57_31980 [Argonema antarcticum A004/B2]|nr:hypothetical protein [Argonema antarcticum A004/B2]
MRIRCIANTGAFLSETYLDPAVGRRHKRSLHAIIKIHLIKLGKSFLSFALPPPHLAI